LESLLENIKFTHYLLSQHLELDPWESIFAEINESTSLVSFHGRIILHVIFEIIYDLSSNFVYNSMTERYVRCAVKFTEDVLRESMPKASNQFLYGNKQLSTAFSSSAELTRSFFGAPHLQALLRVVGKSNLPLIIGELLQNMELKLRNVLHPYVKELQEGMPPKTPLPFYDYKTEGGYGYYQLKLKDIIDYPDLIPEVFQHFREWGNTIVLLRLFDSSLGTVSTQNLIIASPFLGITEEARQRATSESSPLHTTIKSVATILAKKQGIAKATDILKNLVQGSLRTDAYYRPDDRNCSLFRSALHRINLMLVDYRPAWTAQATQDVLIPIDTTNEFYRLWSGIQFVCLIDIQDNEDYKHSNLDMFGDGLMWAGICIIYFLQQRYRFEALDFSYHVARIEEASAKPTDKQHILTFFHRLSSVRDLNNEIFSTLSAYYPLEQGHTQVTLLKPKGGGNQFLYTTGSAKPQTPPSQPPSQPPTQSLAPPKSPQSGRKSARRSSKKRSGKMVPPPPEEAPPPPPPGGVPPPPPQEAPPPPEEAPPPPPGNFPPPPEDLPPPPPPV